MISTLAVVLAVTALTCNAQKTWVIYTRTSGVEVLMKASQELAQRILEPAGVQFIWRNGAPPGTNRPDVDVERMTIEIVPDGMSGRADRALGAAKPFAKGEARIRISYPKLCSTTSDPFVRASILGN